MNNEPVALMTEYGIKPLYEGALQEGMFLYTHPAKTLTDEEINELSEEHLDMDWQTGVIDFARAILKKASEK
jgi:hypothetical protein